MLETWFTVALWYAPCLAAALAAKGLIHTFQLSSYQFGGYVRSVTRRWQRELLPGVLMAALGFGLTAVAGSLQPRLGSWVLVAAALLVVLCGFLLGKAFHAGRTSIKPLRYTPRVKRLFAVLALTMLGLGALLRLWLPVMGLSALMALLLPVWVALAALIAWPVEQLVKTLYQRDAKRKLLQQPGLTRIGITGSFGKTSVKFFLDTLLRQRFSVLATRRSFNTPMGITRVIREDLQPAHRVFIAEMGARHGHDIRALCRFVQPHIGVLTAVGPQHLETFGSIERVRKTKYDLIRALPEDGFAVFCNDQGMVKELWLQTDKRKALVGQPGDDLWAEDVQLNYDGSRFTLCLKDGTRLKCETPVCGEHNIRNILLAAAVARHMGLTDAQLTRGIAQLNPVEARLEATKQADGTVVINNGFNANPESSRASLEMLRGYAGRRIVVTPGFVEMGHLERDYHLQLGHHIAAAADLVLLVGPKRTTPIQQGLLEAGFSADQVHTFGSLKEAQAHLDQIRQAGDVILYENDLPDQYSEGRT